MEEEMVGEARGMRLVCSATRVGGKKKQKTFQCAAVAAGQANVCAFLLFDRLVMFMCLLIHSVNFFLSSILRFSQYILFLRSFT